MTTGQIWSKFTLLNINRILDGPLQLCYTKTLQVLQDIRGCF